MLALLSYPCVRIGVCGGVCVIGCVCKYVRVRVYKVVAKMWSMSEARWMSNICMTYDWPRYGKCITYIRQLSYICQTCFSSWPRFIWDKKERERNMLFQGLWMIVTLSKIVFHLVISIRRIAASICDFLKVMTCHIQIFYKTYAQIC